MLVSTGQKTNIITVETFETRHKITGQRRVGMTDMWPVVNIVYRCCQVIFRFGLAVHQLVLAFTQKTNMKRPLTVYTGSTIIACSGQGYPMKSLYLAGQEMFKIQI